MAWVINLPDTLIVRHRKSGETRVIEKDEQKRLVSTVMRRWRGKEAT